MDARFLGHPARSLVFIMIGLLSCLLFANIGSLLENIKSIEGIIKLEED
jgi:hypothetical protein